jgi:hypothetical protein
LFRAIAAFGERAGKGLFIRSAVVIAIMLGALTLPATARPYAIVGLGDSAAEQLGATVRCEAWVMTPSYACPDGTGFIEQFARSLDRHGPTAFQNLASKFARGNGSEDLNPWRH